MACVASVLETPLEGLPELTRENDHEWQRIVHDACRRLGYALIACTNEPPIAPPGYSIAVGSAMRGALREHHAVVALDGDVVHDPHPTRTGIDDVEYWFLFLPIRREQHVLAQLATDLATIL